MFPQMANQIIVPGGVISPGALSLVELVSPEQLGLVMADSSLYDLLASNSECFVFLSALVSLGAIYTIILFVKNRSSLKLQERLCQSCRESNLNCNIIYNRLFAKKFAPTDQEDRCNRCGAYLDKATKSSRNNKWRSQQQHQLGGYGKKSDVEFIAEPELFTAIEGHSTSPAAADANETSKTHARKLSACTGITFIPEAPDEPLEQVEFKEEGKQQQLITQSSLTSDNSFLTVLEVGPLESLQEEARAEKEEEEPHAETDAEKGLEQTGSGNARFRWVKSVRKAWQTQRILDTLREAGKRVSLTGRAGGDAGAQVEVEEEPEFINSKKLRSADIQIQQHPIIFGKSKDSILVPDLMDSPRSGRRNNNNNMAATVMSPSDGPYPASTTHVLTDEKGHSIKIRIASPPPQRQTQLAKFYQQQKLEQETKQQQLEQQQQQQQNHRDSIVSIGQCSDSPLMGDEQQQQQVVQVQQTGTGSREPSVKSPAPKRCRLSAAGGRHRPKWSAAHTAGQKTDRADSMGKRHHYTGRESSSSRELGEIGLGIEEGKQQHWVEFENDGYENSCQMIELEEEEEEEESDDNNDNEEEEDEGGAGEDETEEEEDGEADGSDSTQAGELEAATRKGQQQQQRNPIEAFNDSNTSEFDDAGWDSRQDTSLDFMGQPTTNQQQQIQQQQQRQLISQQQQHLAHPNDTVMDADLRMTNRLNMELLVLQNAAQSMMGGTGGSMMGGRAPGGAHSSVAGVAAAMARGSRKSLTGSAGGFPQCGILQSASGYHQPSRQSCEQQDQQQPPGHCSPDLRKPRASSGDSGLAGSIDSRRSSLAPAVPSIRLLIRRISTQATTPVETGSSEQLQARRAGFLGTLASIGRSGSRASSQESADWQPPAAEPLYEITLLEARNVLGPRRQAQTAGAGGGSSGGVGAASDQAAAHPVPGGLGGSMAAAAAAAAVESRGRRESLLGVLVAATQPSSSRRSSLDGVMVRVFKNQAQPEGAHERRQQQATRSDSSEHQQLDSLSLHSTMSISSTTSMATSGVGAANGGGGDYIQLPLVKLPTSSGLQQNSVDKIPLMGQQFVCRQSEFPLRVSLYQVAKRGGARFTLGHCFVLPSDWQQQQLPAADTNTSTTVELTMLNSPKSSKRLSSESSSSSSELSAITMDQLARSRFVLLPANLCLEEVYHESQDSATGSDHQQPQRHLLEYRLHQTILEAIK